MSARLSGLLGALLALTLLSAGNAQAHNSHGWYWNAAAGQSGLTTRYSDVLRANCVGFGAVYHGRFKHFSCYAATIASEPDYRLTLHVLGKYGFTVSNFRDVPKPPPVVVPAPPTTNYPGTGYPVICSDGTLSYSGGKQGACSWHGGVG